MNHDELEWQAQEQARLAEHNAPSAAADAADHNGYRRVARALRDAPMAALPPDFARKLALRVEAEAGGELDTRFEQGLTHALGGALALGAAICAWRYGADWVQASAPLIAEVAPLTGWGLVVAGCVAVSWLGGRLQSIAAPRR